MHTEDSEGMPTPAVVSTTLRIVREVQEMERGHLTSRARHSNHSTADGRIASRSPRIINGTGRTLVRHHQRTKTRWAVDAEQHRAQKLVLSSETSGSSDLENGGGKEVPKGCALAIAIVAEFAVIEREADIFSFRQSLRRPRIPENENLLRWSRRIGRRSRGCILERPRWHWVGILRHPRMGVHGSETVNVRNILKIGKLARRVFVEGKDAVKPYHLQRDDSSKKEIREIVAGLGFRMSSSVAGADDAPPGINMNTPPKKNASRRQAEQAEEIGGLGTEN
ncbi:hypothetical protein DFH06DRAFT_1122195 [Mycena polygramma]|nr:hypothetical protein DFH06DRAFT_1122195 [Mycena polygramma]